MKKLLLLGASALGLALITDRPADAWINSRFSVGLNWNWQSGGNNFMWGLFRNSQPPGPDGGFHGPGPAHGPGFPGIAPYGPQEFQYFGNNQQPPAPLPQGTPAPVPAAQQQSTYAPNYAPNYMPNLQQAVNYYPVSYNTAAYNPYFYSYYPNNFAPGYYGYFQSPSYWYNR